ncbi:MAG: hypothetical protein IJT04_07685 [Bacteroidales bacterium]|nr:hypothetical protein [Bacteroidales bacterium]
MTVKNLELTYDLKTKHSYYPNSKESDDTSAFSDLLTNDSTEESSTSSSKKMSKTKLLEAIKQHQETLRYKIEHPKETEEESKIQIGNAAYSEEEWDKLMAKVDRLLEDSKEVADEKEKLVLSQKIEDEEAQKIKNRYFANAKDGMLEYNGIVYFCNENTGALELGDCSKPDNCLRVSLSGGGSLIVNPDNFKELSKSIGLFNSEDQMRIIAALEMFKMANKKMEELEEEEKDDPTDKEDTSKVEEVPEGYTSLDELKAKTSQTKDSIIENLQQLSDGSLLDHKEPGTENVFDERHSFDLKLKKPGQ